MGSRGADIEEVNTIRQHLSKIKGGKLLTHLPKSTKTISLILSDVINSPINLIASGLTVYSSPNIAQAVTVLEKYKIENFEKIICLIKNQPEFTHNIQFENHNHLIIGQNSLAVELMLKELLKYHSTIKNIGSNLQGNNLKLTETLFKDYYLNQTSFIGGGETTVNLLTNDELNLNKNVIRKGGRNMEIVLKFLTLAATKPIP